ncbi:MAG: MBOAT family protein [Chitinophagales bacterium]|nr:MBOAT family protein [Chitinophagales bacterium]
MLLNSLDFAIFLPIVLILYWIIGSKRVKLQNILLLIASYIFYGWWDWRFLSLIFISSIVDYTVGNKIHQTEDNKKRKYLLIISLIVNLGFLGFFKYANFFIDSFNNSFNFLGIPIQGSLLNIILPVGISFYTFQTLSYTIDIYKRQLEPSENILNFLTFVSFFPQLVAGPIERASNLLPQFSKNRDLTYAYFSQGFKYIVFGFFMKVVVADRAAIYVNAVYNNVVNHDGITFVFATLAFCFQIYGDFAGYSLIAIGTAKFFGFDLMTNFNRPYFSTSVKQFWTRWHISLSTWFRDYLYIPLGGNKTTKPRWLSNLFITFLISGLWHGANWTFVIWGALNGFYLIIESVLFKKRKTNALNLIITFILINFAWIFFRANSVNDAFTVIKDIFTNSGRLYIGEGEDVTSLLYTIMAITMLLFVETFQEYFSNLLQKPILKNRYVKMTAYAILIFIILYLGVFDESQFIYFQF